MPKLNAATGISVVKLFEYRQRFEQKKLRGVKLYWKTYCELYRYLDHRNRFREPIKEEINKHLHSLDYDIRFITTYGKAIVWTWVFGKVSISIEWHIPHPNDERVYNFNLDGKNYDIQDVGKGVDLVKNFIDDIFLKEVDK